MEIPIHAPLIPPEPQFRTVAPSPHRERCIITSRYGYLSLNAEGQVCYLPELDTAAVRIFASVKQAKSVAKHLRENPKVVRVSDLPSETQAAIRLAVEGAWVLTHEGADGKLLFLHRGDTSTQYRLLPTMYGAVGYATQLETGPFIGQFLLENRLVLKPQHTRNLTIAAQTPQP